MSFETQNYANWSDSEESDGNQDTKILNSEERRCKYCAKLMKNLSDLLKHEKSCTEALNNTADLVTCKDGRKRFLCDICFRFFKYLTGLNKHKKWHEPPGGFVCRYCHAKYCTSQELERHKEDTHQVYKCQICKRIHETLDDYLDHIKSEHNGLDRVWVRCEDCNLNFKSQIILNYHRKTKCGTIKSFQCNVCESRFQTQTTLNVHKLIHTAEKSFCCSYCGKDFLSKGELTVHERKHTGEKPYKCEVCSKSFSYRESLVTHSSLHTGIKPYACEACDARFSCVGNLQKHRRTRPNSCGLPQYCVNKKAAPRPSIRLPGTLTMSNVKITKANKVIGLTKEIKTVTKANKDNIVQKVQDKVDVQTEKQNESLLEEILGDDENVSQQSCLQSLNIQVLDNSTSKENKTTTGMNYELEMNCFVLTDESQIKMITSSTEKKGVKDERNKSKTLSPTLKETVSKEQSKDNKNSHSKQIEICKNKIVDSDGYDHLNSETATYNNDQIMLVLIKEDDEDKLPLSVIQETLEVENVNADDLQNNMQEVVIEAEISDKTSLSGDMNDLENCNAFCENSTASEENDSESEIFYNHSETYECQNCPKIYKHRRSFLKHLENDHHLEQLELKQNYSKIRRRKSGLHSCMYCEKYYSRPKWLESHIKCHGPEGKLIHKSKCCRRYFETEEGASKHDREVHYDMIVCPICGKIYSNPDKMAAHNRYAHMKGKDQTENTKKKFSVCQKCGKKFNSKTVLSDHERSDCGRSPLYRCNVCNKNFHSAGSLKTHKTIHTGELAHLCNYCGKAFRTFGQVKVHQRKHNGEKPFKCETCSKSFAYRESLLTHVSIHTGVKRFICKGCGRRFSCISNLLTHRKYNRSTCGMTPSSTKPFSEAMGVSGGILYVGEKPEK